MRLQGYQGFSLLPLLQPVINFTVRPSMEENNLKRYAPQI